MGCLTSTSTHLVGGAQQKHSISGKSQVKLDRACMVTTWMSRAGHEVVVVVLVMVGRGGGGGSRRSCNPILLFMVSVLRPQKSHGLLGTGEVG